MKKTIIKIFPAVDFYWKMVGWRLLILSSISALVGFSESVGLGLLVPIFQGFQSEASGAATLSANPMISALSKYSPWPMSLNLLLGIFVGFMILKAVFRYTVLNYSWVLISNMSFKIRKTLISKMLNLDYKAYLSLETGRISSVMTTEVDRCMSGFQYFTSYISSFFTGFSFIVILFWVNFRFSLTIIVLGGLYYAFFKPLTDQIRKVSMKITSESAFFNSVLIQVFQSFKYIRAAAFNVPFGVRLEGSVRKITNDKVRVMRRQGLLNVLRELSLMSLLLVAFFVNLKYFNSDFASILLSVVLFYRASGYMMNSQTIWGNYVAMAGGTASVVENDRWLLQNAEPKFGTKDAVFENFISLQNVDFGYNVEDKILDNISLVIPKNSTVAFVGKSGSGKSTLVNLLTGLLRPNAGEIFVDNLNLNDLDISSWRKKIGYVTQEPILFTDTVRNNITMWSEPSADVEARYDSAIKKAHIDEFIVDVGGDSVSVGDKGSLLSGGQKQRISIAREFFKTPDLLIFDEATSSLDAESEAFIQRSIDEQRGAVTTIIIAHRLSTLRNADIIFLIDKGRIVEQGSFDELMAMKGSSFYEFVKLQAV